MRTMFAQALREEVPISEAHDEAAHRTKKF